MKKLYAYFFLSILSLPGISQQDTILLEDISISVTPFTQRISESSGSLSILKTNPGEIGNTINIAEQLNTVPGVYMAAGTNTTNRLTIRGVGSRTPYSSNRIRAYYEDLPLTNGDGISTLEDIDLSGISRMEILKGPASALYGSGLGGVIKLRANYPSKNGVSCRVFSNYSSFNTWRNGLSLGFKKNGTSISTGYSRSSSNGFRENSFYGRDQLILNAKTGFAKNILHVNIILTHLNAQIPSSINESDFKDSPWKAAQNWLDIAGYEEYSKINGGVSWKHYFNDRWKNNLLIFSSWHDPYESRPFNILDDFSTIIGMRESILYENKIFQFQTGFELFHERYTWSIFETLSGIQGREQLKNREIRSYGNLFSHIKWSPVSSLNLEAGMNFNMLQYQLETIYEANGLDQSGSYTYTPVVSPRIGLNYQFLQGHFFHLSAGHGFSAPSLEETLLPEGRVNTDLKPETGWNFDLGFKGWAWEKRWYYDLSAYSIFIRNMLVTKRLSEDTFTGINAGAVQLAGIEFYSKIALNDPHSSAPIKNFLEFSLYLNSNTFTDFIDDEVDHSRNNLPGIPAQLIHLRIKTEYRKSLELMAEIRYNGKQFMNDANTAIYKDYLIADARISYKIKSSKLPFTIHLNAGINNLLNTNYASMILVNAPSFGSSAPRYYYPGMPRNYSFGLRVER